MRLTLRDPLTKYAVNSYRAQLSPASLCTVLHNGRRSYATTSPVSDAPPAQKHVAILGAGVTGLSTAYHLLQTPNPPKITIIEKSDRIGGWLRSKYVRTPNGEVLFETGPRNVRPVMPLGLATVALWEDIGLSDHIIFTPRDSVAAKKRWIYYPDHLVEVPGPSRGVLANLWSLLTEDAFKGYIKDMAYELSVPGRPREVDDESVGDFVSRRVNKHLVNKLASGVLHGVYAGDAWNLSARSVVPDAWFAEKLEGNVFMGMMRIQREGWMRKRNADLMAFLAMSSKPSAEIMTAVKQASTVTLDEGLELMARRLAEVVQKAGVEIRMNTEVTQLGDDNRQNHGSKLSLIVDQQREQYDQVVSTIPAKHLLAATSYGDEPSVLPILRQSKTVTVNVVNLYYDNPNILPKQGFGYLIPQATPLEQNPELALGVVFDSDVVPYGQDRLDVLDPSRAEEARGTKLTVMLGGHWYNSLDSIPDEEHALWQAKNVVARHLGITVEPTASLVSCQKDCIPQPTVGHVSRLKKAHEALLREFGGRLKVAGGSFGGVSINECVVAGMEVAALVQGSEPTTGLEWAARDEDMEFVRAGEYLKKQGLQATIEDEERPEEEGGKRR